MKKLFSLLVLLMGAMTAWAEELTVVEVTTWEGIKSYLNDADKGSKVCKLMNDIDFNGGTIPILDSYTINAQDELVYSTIENFTIDGNNCTIKNGVIEGRHLFGSIKDATIKKLKFDNIQTPDSEPDIAKCILAKNSYACHFENLSFNNCSVPNYCIGIVCSYAYSGTTFTNITVTHCSIVASNVQGGIVGYAQNITMDNCHVSDVNLNCQLWGAGGLVGEVDSYSDISNCSFRGKIYSDGIMGNASAGGIVGRIYETSENYGISNIRNCQNYGEVEADGDCVGGIVGYALKATIENCKNTGWIHHKKLTGTDDEIGGILGSGLAVQISQCVNAGSIDGGDAYVGGIVGLLEGNSSIINCVNGGFVNGDENVGGIAGQIRNQTTVSYCIGASNRIEGNSHVQILVGEEPSGSTHDNYWISETSNIEVGAVTKDDLMSGKVTWHINNKANLSENVWTQNLETDAYPVIGTAGVHYARTMANEWGTIVLPFDVTYSPSNGNYKLYKLSDASVSGNEGTLTFSEYATGTIAAGTPMAVKKLTGEGIDIAPASTPNFNTTISPVSEVANWTMQGTYIDLNDQTGIYYIAQDQFWYADDPISIAPYRAWFAGPAFTSAQNAALRIVESDGSETSTIGEITADGNVNFFDTPIYNIQGQRQQVGQKGLQIRNGKVILINN